MESRVVLAVGFRGCYSYLDTAIFISMGCDCVTQKCYPKRYMFLFDSGSNGLLPIRSWIGVGGKLLALSVCRILVAVVVLSESRGLRWGLWFVVGVWVASGFAASGMVSCGVWVAASCGASGRERFMVMAMQGGSMVHKNQMVVRVIRESGILKNNQAVDDRIFKAKKDNRGKIAAKIDFDTCVTAKDMKKIEESCFAVRGMWPKDGFVRVRLVEE